MLIQTPFSTFLDIDGKPLENGYVWVGAENLDPQSSPVATFWDEALTIAATQPIRTKGGYPANAGTPGRIYTLNPYSIRVQNKNGAQVFLSLKDNDLFATGSAADITFLQAGTGAVPISSQSKMRQAVYVEDYGAVGDGVTDDTAAFNAAKAASRHVRFGSKTYLVDGLVFNFSGQNGVIFEGDSPVKSILKIKAGSTRGLSVTGNFNQYNVFQNFTIDPSLMANASTTYGLYLKETYGNSFRNVNVFPSLSNQRALRCDTGVYTTVFDNCGFQLNIASPGVIEFQGISLSDAVTTVTMIGCSFGKCIMNFCVGMTFVGSILQGSANKFEISNIRGVNISGSDIEGTGVCYALGANVDHFYVSGNVFVGFSGTYQTGTFVTGYMMDIYGGVPFQFIPNTLMEVSNGWVNENQSQSVLTRKRFRNSSGVGQITDIQIQNVTGSSYWGLSAAGVAGIDNRTSNPTIVLSQNGTTRFGVDASNRLIVDTTTTTTATAGAAGALPAQVKGYFTFVNSLGTPIGKIPYYEI
jgi:hypothetical protein